MIALKYDVDVSKVFDRLCSLYSAPSLRQLSKKLGQSPNWASQQKRNGTIPTEYCLMASKQFQVSLDHIFFGSPRQPDDELLIHLDFFEVSASAGTGMLVHDHERRGIASFQPEFIYKELGVLPKNVFLMQVTGDSMSPTLKDNALIMVDKSVLHMPLTDGIYVYRHNSEVFVKRLQLLPSNYIKIISDNPNYLVTEVAKNLVGEEFDIQGKVIWVGQSV